jgi:hypothetical protein
VKEQPVRLVSGITEHIEMPADSGSVITMAAVDGCVVVCCTNGVFKYQNGIFERVTLNG